MVSPRSRSRPRPGRQPHSAGLARRGDPWTCAWAWAAAPSVSLPAGRRLLLSRSRAWLCALRDTHSQRSSASLLPSPEHPGVKGRVGRGPAPLPGWGGACSWALPSQAPTVLPTVHWDAASPPRPCQLFPPAPPSEATRPCLWPILPRAARGWAVWSGPVQRGGPGCRGPWRRVTETRLPGRQSWKGLPSLGRLLASP